MAVHSKARPEMQAENYENCNHAPEIRLRQSALGKRIAHAVALLGIGAVQIIAVLVGHVGKYLQKQRGRNRQSEYGRIEPSVGGRKHAAKNDSRNR
ncbi:MAG: hypothetical protein L6V35_05075 [Alistipes putredinis]|nr:MAG: hypothetical protein L6V35_05075 [Alistipes putredinis]